MLTLLHLDDQLLLIDKPSGLPVLPDGWEPDAPYLIKLLEADYGRIWVVHRLDKVTSGVMVFARTAEAHRALNIQLERHEAEKVYHCITASLPPWEEKTTRFPLRANVGHSHRTVVDDRKGKPAETRFKVLADVGGITLCWRRG
jgi:23S rRNA-/tRNA-specific pseudouridylate synthase